MEARRIKSFARYRHSWLFAAIVGTAGCAVSPHVVPVDPSLSFAAHGEHRGIVLDKLPDGQPAVLVTAWSPPFFGGPRLRLQRDGTVAAAIWLDGAHAVVRTEDDRAAAPVGQVDAAWEAGAIRLTLKPVGNAWFRTGIFERIDGRAAPAALGQHAQTIFDVRGVYRAQLVDRSGAPAGWLRVRVSPSDERFYDGVLPPGVSGPLVAAVVAQLDAAVATVEDHAENPYIGN